MKEILNRFIFRDRAEVMGKVVYDLGNIYQHPGLLIQNSSVLFFILQSSHDEISQLRENAEQNIDALERTQISIDKIMLPMGEAEMEISHSELVQREFGWVAKMLQHACKRGIWILKKISGEYSSDDIALQQDLHKDADALIAEYEEIWHARSRPGGFTESVARMHGLRSSYE
jgi:hypothetical protein